MLKSISSILNFNSFSVAQLRLKIIEFHNQYKTKATVDAYSILKPTIYRWKKRLKDSHGRLESLIPDFKSAKNHKTNINLLTNNYLYQEFKKKINQD